MPKITLIETNTGKFYKAFLNEEPITESELFKLIGLEKYPSGFRLSKHLEDFFNSSKGYSIEIFEKDVS